MFTNNNYFPLSVCNYYTLKNVNKILMYCINNNNNELGFLLFCVVTLLDGLHPFFCNFFFYLSKGRVFYRLTISIVKCE